MGSFLEILVQYLVELLPIRIIRNYQAGVRFTWGKRVSPVSPGVHLRLLGLSEIDVIDVAEQVIKLPVQRITTKDRKAVSIRGEVCYRITDPVKYHTAVLHTDISIVNLCLAHMHYQVRRRDAEKILNRQSGLEKAIVRRLSPAAERWGLEILTFCLTDLVETRAYTIIGDSPFPG
ncbi:MAG TPA: SPFH domain-containing protein [Gemmatimonadales bacterium]|nr:SPFH domain-containing protein [Gemmatimonadales bacterium]